MNFSLTWRDWAEDAYPIVVRAVYNALRRQSFASSVAAEFAQEGTQHAFLKLLERRNEVVFDAPQYFVAYLRKSALNRVKEELRRKRPLPIGAAPRAQDDMSGDRVGEIVHECLTKELNHEERRMLELKYEEGLTDQAIAGILLPPDDRTVSARGQDLRRRRLEAEKKLRNSLMKKGIGPFALELGRTYNAGD